MAVARSVSWAFLAKSVLDNGGNVTGIIPEFLQEREVMLDSCARLDRHSRTCTKENARCSMQPKPLWRLPGGIGTLEEVVEMLTWAQLGQHKKPILLANIDGFWDPLARLFDHMEDEAFLPSGYGHHLLDRADPPTRSCPCCAKQLASIPEDKLSGITARAALSMPFSRTDNKPGFYPHIALRYRQRYHTIRAQICNFNRYWQPCLPGWLS